MLSPLTGGGGESLCHSGYPWSGSYWCNDPLSWTAGHTHKQNWSVIITMEQTIILVLYCKKNLFNLLVKKLYCLVLMVNKGQYWTKMSIEQQNVCDATTGEFSVHVTLEHEQKQKYLSLSVCFWNIVLSCFFPPRVLSLNCKQQHGSYCKILEHYFFFYPQCHWITYNNLSLSVVIIIQEENKVYKCSGKRTITISRSEFSGVKPVGRVISIATIRTSFGPKALCKRTRTALTSNNSLYVAKA